MGPTTEIEEQKREAVKPPISREQRRRREAINSEVQQKLKAFHDKFLDFFTNCDDPEGHEVVEKMKQLDAQWRVYCKNKELIPAAYPVINVYMAGVVQEYFDTKNGKTAEQIPEEQPKTAD